jgi:hypothetical protein
MLMIIFGAGASYDSSSENPTPDSVLDSSDPLAIAKDELYLERMPLAKQLFQNRPIFTAARRTFVECTSIMNDLTGKDVPVEEMLQTFKDQAAINSRRHTQLAAIRFYLRQIIQQTQVQWLAKVHEVHNYKSLFDQIENWRAERKDQSDVCIVTFNYDTLIEHGLIDVGLNISEIGHYVGVHPYKFFKLHGSINWWREVRGGAANFDQVISCANDLQLGSSIVYRNYNEDKRPLMHLQGLWFPAIAIPVSAKTVFECPAEHQAVLKTMLPQIDKILTVGWRGAEVPFVELLRDHLPSNVRGLVVSAGKDDTDETVNRLNKVGISGIKRYESGFTSFVKNHAINQLLRD